MTSAFSVRACVAAAMGLLLFSGCSKAPLADRPVDSLPPISLKPRSAADPNHAYTGLTLSGAQAQDKPAAAGGEKERAAAAGPSIANASSEGITVSERLLDEPTRRVLKLSNGFTVILQQNKTAPIVAVRIYVKAGSLTEQQWMGAGLSHVLEHLVAGSSSGKRKEAENTLLLQQIGNDSNAYTDYDHTCYFITTSSEKWPVALDLLADWTTAADFTREQFNREYQVVQRELEMGEAEALRTFYIHAGATRYLSSPAKHPVIGYKPAFQKLTFEDAKAYYKEMYVPDNMVVSVAGDIDLDAAEKQALKEFSGVQRKVVPAVAIPPEPAVIVPRQTVAHADVKQARIMWTFPTTDLYSPDLYATDVLSSILGGSESSVLVEKIRDQQGLVVDINTMNDTPRYAPGGLEIVATLDAEKIPAAQKAVLAVLDDVLKNGVNEEQLKRAKAQASASLVYENQTAEQQAIRNADNFLSTGNIDFNTAYVHRIEAVTAEQVQAAAKKFIVQDHMLTTVLLPLKAANPFKVAPSKSTVQGESATRKFTLDNGLTVLITPNASAPIVTFNFYALGGLLAETDANNGTGNAMMQLLTRGTTTRSHEQISDFLDSTATSLSAASGNNTFALSSQALKQNAPAAFDLFADVILHPAFNSQELQQLRPQLKAAIDEAGEDWYEEAYKATRQEYYADSPYKRLASGSTAVVDKVTTDQIRKHYETFFLDPRKSVLAIAGDIDEQAALALAKKLQAIPQPAAAPALAAVTTAAPAHTVTKATAKQSATVFFAYPPGTTADSPDRYAVDLLQTYLGGWSSPGGSVLHETLRGKGLVYTVQASAIPSVSLKGGGMFLISALGEPDKVPQIVQLVNKIIADVKAGKISEQSLAAIKDQAITGELLSKQTIADKSSARALDELFGLGFNEDARFAENIRKVTADDILKAAQKYLQAPTIVILTPDHPQHGSGGGE